jgi:hypothetical protein
VADTAATFYANTCSICGAHVLLNGQEGHNLWHQGLTEVLRQLVTQAFGADIARRAGLDG